jgi:glycosyltransferase involved in cell wall biosynthesis
MAHGKLVLAPDITGIPELVIARKTGFLYLAGCVEDLIDRIVFIHSLIRAEGLRQAHVKGSPFLLSSASVLDWMRHAAREQVHANFNRTTNLKSFGDSFVPRIASRSESIPHENFVLQQI